MAVGSRSFRQRAAIYFGPRKRGINAVRNLQRRFRSRLNRRRFWKGMQPNRRLTRKSAFSGVLTSKTIDHGTTTLKRASYTTVIYNNSTADAYATWVNADNLAGGVMPFNWNLWYTTTSIYAGAGTVCPCTTEQGGSATGSAGEVVRGRIRVTMNDCMIPADLNNWEYVRLDYVNIYFQYQCTDYTAGNDANGLIPKLQYFVDTDGTFVTGTSTPEQDSITELERRLNVRSVSLRRGKTVKLTVKPTVFSVVQADPAGSYFTGSPRHPGWLDPNTSAVMTSPLSNLQFQIRNLQLPGGTDNTQQTSCVKVWAMYHYSCKNFIGQGVN